MTYTDSRIIMGAADSSFTDTCAAVNAEYVDTIGLLMRAKPGGLFFRELTAVCGSFTLHRCWKGWYRWKLRVHQPKREAFYSLTRMCYQRHWMLNEVHFATDLLFTSSAQATGHARWLEQRLI